MKSAYACSRSTLSPCFESMMLLPVAGSKVAPFRLVRPQAPLQWTQA